MPTTSRAACSAWTTSGAATALSGGSFSSVVGSTPSSSNDRTEITCDVSIRFLRSRGYLGIRGSTGRGELHGGRGGKRAIYPRIVGITISDILPSGCGLRLYFCLRGRRQVLATTPR